MKLHQVSSEVFVAASPIVQLGREEIDFLKEKASCALRKRARICAHRDDGETIHEMIIAIASSSYIRPHRHVGKSESFHVIDGEVDVVILSEKGEIEDVIELGGPNSGRCFYYRLAESKFHTLLIHTEMLVIHEVTDGPFDRERTTLAPFAPSENDADRAKEYMAEIAAAAARHTSGRAKGPVSQ